MTTSENVGRAYMLSEVEKQIRKDIPRLMELREGCLVRKDKEIFRVNEDPKRDGYNVGKYYYPDENSIKEKYEIIGHDIMLNDVLEWLNKRINENIFGRYVLQANGEFRIISKDEEGYDVEFTGIKWNLQSPHLNIDQSEELIKFLYNLIKE